MVHLAGEMINIEANGDATHVPFQGGPPSMAALVSNNVTYTASNISNPLPLVKAGKLKAIATTGSKRPAELADIPTMQESGFPNFEVTVWVGLFGPKNLPPNLVNVIYKVVNETLADPLRKSLRYRDHLEEVARTARRRRGGWPHRQSRGIRA